MVEDNFLWNKVAKWYDNYIKDEGSDFHRYVIFPCLMDLLNAKKEDSIKNKKIVDLACGNGVLCRTLASINAKVTGIDIAPSLVRMAKKRKGDNEEYITADCTKLLSQNGNLKFDLENESYDYATIILAIQNINPLTPLVKATAKLLKQNGSVIVVMMHPAFRIPKYADWIYNDKENRQERTIWKYLESESIDILTNPGEKNSDKTIHYHRPLKAYINTFASQGLYLTKMEELPTYKGEQKSAKSKAILKAKQEIPMFLALKFTKM